MFNQLNRVAIWGAVASLPLICHAGTAPPEPPLDGQKGWYVGLGGGSLAYEEPGFTACPVNSDYIYVQGGWQQNRFLSFDARVGTHVANGSNYFFCAPFSLRVQSLYAVYTRVTVPVSPRFELFALGGYAGINVSADISMAAVKDTADSISFGLGASWRPNPQVAVDLEYLPMLAQASGWKSSAINIGIRVRF